MAATKLKKKKNRNFLQIFYELRSILWKNRHWQYQLVQGPSLSQNQWSNA